MDWNSGRANWTARGEVRRLAPIWLSKPRLLCEHAVKRPDALTVFIDAGLTHDRSSWANMRRAVRLHKNGTLGVQAYDLLHYHGRKSGDEWRALRWFKRVECTAPIANVRYMTVRGRDCARLMSAYDAALADERRGCGCFDEETTLARMFHRQPWLFNFVGVLSAGSQDEHATEHTCASLAPNQARRTAGNATSDGAAKRPPQSDRVPQHEPPVVQTSTEQHSSSIRKRRATIAMGASGAPVLPTTRGDATCSLLFRSVAPACPVRPRPPSRVAARCGRPEYLILGARKGGTTSLHYYLTTHPDVFAYKLRGEPQDGENPYELAAPEHAREYAAARGGQLVGDSNVSRLSNDATAIARCYATGPPRMIALLREPIGRCISQMQMRMRLRTKTFHMNSLQHREYAVAYNTTTNLTKVVQLDLWRFEAYARKRPNLARMRQPPQPNKVITSPPNCLYEGAYVLHLRRLLASVPSSALRLYWSDDFFNDTTRAAVMRDAFAFLGLDASAAPRLADLTARAYNARPADRQQAARLTPTMERRMHDVMSPFNQQLSLLLNAPLPAAWHAAPNTAPM